MNKKQSAFTIVELLVVIVIIGILAAITIISYTGITQKATAASLQADLANASKKLKIWQLTESADGSYPDHIDCSLPNNSISPNTNLCIKPSGSNDLNTCYLPNNTNVPPTFLLTATNGTMAYEITENTAPTLSSGCGELNTVAITGNTDTVGGTLVATLTPADDTATYQWQVATTPDGPYIDIPGVDGSGSTHTISSGDVGQYFRVTVTSPTNTYTYVISRPTPSPASEIVIDGTYDWLFALSAEISTPASCSDTGATPKYAVYRRSTSETQAQGIKVGGYNDGHSHPGSTNPSSTAVLIDAHPSTGDYRYWLTVMCYKDATHYSDIVSGPETEYNKRIDAPAQVNPYVASFTSSQVTYTWSPASCAPGTNVKYEYHLTRLDGPVGTDDINTHDIFPTSGPYPETTDTTITLDNANPGQWTTFVLNSYCYNTISRSANQSEYLGWYREVAGVKVLVVGGGGGGGYGGGGGGGAGGLVYNSSFNLSSQSYTVTVGNGGAGSSSGSGGNGGDSSFSTVSAIGGGGGGKNSLVGLSGGSGGGGGLSYGATSAGGTPIAGQGYAGGIGGGNSYGTEWGGAGGGGSGAIGGNYAPYAHAGNGGDGTSNSISGAAVIYGGGGGGAYWSSNNAGAGGAGGGGSGGQYSHFNGYNAVGYGSGGGGGGYDGYSQGGGGSGSSGIVVISYPTGSLSASGGVVTVFGSNTIHTFTSPSDTFTVF